MTTDVFTIESFFKSMDNGLLLEFMKQWGLEYGKDTFDAFSIERVVGRFADSEEYATVP
ncbi:MAG: hypothetical protein Q4C95_12850 [Planctomycetia bacterium]|nr:hypothetical protein [Planctomycetia bacterium]